MTIRFFALRLCVISILLNGNLLLVSAGTLFFDGYFDDDQWDFYSIANATGDGYVVSSRTGEGGHPDAYRQVINYVVTSALQTRTSVVGLHVNSAAVYDPSEQGAIKAITFSLDYMNSRNAYGNGQRFGPALVQDSRIYLGVSSGIIQKYLRTRAHGTQPLVWQRINPTSFGEHDFVMVDTSAENLAAADAQPDFSIAGSPITFGFFTFNTNPPGLSEEFTSFITVGYDNWEINVRSTAKPADSFGVDDSPRSDSSSAPHRVEGTKTTHIGDTQRHSKL